SKRLPIWNEGSRFGPEVGPDQAGMRLDRIGLDANLIFEAGVLRADIIVRLLDTPPRFVEQPAVIITPQTALLDETIREIGTAMRALPVDETERTLQIFVENKVFPEKTDRFRGFSIEFRYRRDRHPIAPQEFAHGSTWTDTSKALT